MIHKKNKLYKTLIASIGLAILPAMAEDSGLLTSTSLAETSLEQIESCLEYTIHGITLRAIYTPWGVYYFWTPNVSHFSPDLLSMSHKELDDMPYLEFQKTFGAALKPIAQKGFADVVGKTVGSLNADIGGGRYQHKDWGDYQAGQFSESTVIGNPAAMFIDAFTWNGLRMAGKEVSKAAELSSTDAQDYLEGFKKGNGKAEWSDSFDNAMNYDMTMQVMANSPVVQSIKQIVRQIDSAVSSMQGRTGDSPFCPVYASAFQPFYLSGVDSYLWRLGYPVTDSEHSDVILNPLSTDIVGTGGEQWGHIYPRDGAVNHQEAQKVAAVVAVRSKQVLAEGGMGRLYREPDYKMKRVVWSKVYPQPKKNCHVNIANTGTETESKDRKDRYAWNLWTNHRCDLYRRGVPIAFIPIGPIHVTPVVPE